MKKNTKKIIGSIIPFVIIEALLISMLSIVLYNGLIDLKNMPILFFIFIGIYLLIPIICLIVSLISRIKEIKSGEEDEASKY